MPLRQLLAYAQREPAVGRLVDAAAREPQRAFASASLRPFLLGVAAAVVGLIGAVTVQIVNTSVVDVYTAILAIASFCVLLRFHGKLTVLYVVAGCGAIGALLQLTLV